MERFFYALAGNGWLLDREYGWDGKYGSSTCPACNSRSYLWFTDYEGQFRFGCRERCDKQEILSSLGLDGYDVTPGVPKWLKRW